jgi:hypothetical protein
VNNSSRGRTRTHVAAVVAMLVLLSWNGTASAECAWVLWIEHQAWGSATPAGAKHEWEIGKVHDARDRCSVDAKDRVTKLSTDVWKREAEGKSRSHTQVTEDTVSTQFLSRDWTVPTGGTAIRFRCLPDTIDPRAPKEK